MFRLSRAFRLHQQLSLRQPTRLQHPQIRSQIQSRNVWTRRNPPPTDIRRVRFRRPWFSYKGMATVAVKCAIIYGVYEYFMQYIDVSLEELEEEELPVRAEDEEEEEGEEDEFADEDSWFVAMTWAKKLPRSFYKGSDPEWKEFVKIAKDKPRHKRLQDELVQLVFKGAQQHPRVGMQIGKNLQIGKYWLEISFPDGPPQEYVRSGIEIGDDFIAWSPQRISPEQQFRITRALWPQATVIGIWETAKITSAIQYRRMKQALGWEEVNPFSPEERFKVAIEALEKKKQNASGRGGSPVNAQTSPNGAPGSLVSAASAANEAQTSPKDADLRIALPWELSLPMPPTISGTVNPTDVQIAKHVFLGALMKNWMPKRLEPPRGSFVVQGLVEVKGSKGKIMFDVQSCYDPKENKFVTVNAGMRSTKAWSQRPKGGA